VFKCCILLPIRLENISDITLQNKKYNVILFEEQTNFVLIDNSMRELFQNITAGNVKRKVGAPAYVRLEKEGIPERGMHISQRHQ